MSFRTVVINSRCKLEYSLNYLVCRGEDTKRINIDEISVLIIQNVGVAVTAALLSKLLASNVKVIFCDPQANPQGELSPYYGSYDSYEKIGVQMDWKDKTKSSLWGLVIKEKILRQANNLGYLGNPLASLLREYAEGVLPGDPTNREGHAAKVYFAACFGKDFSRDEKCDVNAFLDYGYSIVLSAINREVKSLGYLTELGIHHIGKTNPFNLSCDFMEPIRPLVDYLILSKKVNKDNFKTEMVALLAHRVKFEGSEMFFDNALHLYVQSLLAALRDDKTGKAKFIDYELS